MKDATRGHAPSHRLQGAGLEIGIVQARFNADITDAMAAACAEELLRLGVEPRAVEHVTVPGALEIPIALQALALQDRFDALIAIGCVIRGETYHFELVANESGAGITRVALDETVPIANAVITVENATQAGERMKIKGIEAARCAVEMAHLVGGLLDAVEDER